MNMTFLNFFLLFFAQNLVQFYRLKSLLKPDIRQAYCGFPWKSWPWRIKNVKHGAWQRECQEILMWGKLALWPIKCRLVPCDLLTILHLPPVSLVGSLTSISIDWDGKKERKSGPDFEAMEKPERGSKKSSSRSNRRRGERVRGQISGKVHMNSEMERIRELVLNSAEMLKGDRIWKRSDLTCEKFISSRESEKKASGTWKNAFKKVLARLSNTSRFPYCWIWHWSFSVILLDEMGLGAQFPAGWASLMPNRHGKKWVRARHATLWRPYGRDILLFNTHISNYSHKGFHPRKQYSRAARQGLFRDCSETPIPLFLRWIEHSERSFFHSFFLSSPRELES